MSQALTLARPYARAAFAAAADRNAADIWSKALVFAAQVAAQPEAKAVLDHPLLSHADAVGLLVMDGADDGFTRFLTTLAENRRLPLLPEIAGLFEQLRNEANRVVKATVTTATPASDSELAAIREALKRRFGREVEIESTVDESLIGGAIIDAGDVVIDGSIKGKLASLQNAIGN